MSKRSREFNEGKVPTADRLQQAVHRSGYIVEVALLVGKSREMTEAK